MIKKSPLFGTDGIRGKANYFPMTVETILCLGKALAIVLKESTEHPQVVIGKDTRLSGYMFESALVAGLISMGVDTLLVGPLPTPGISFITRAYRADAGVVISASHNPFFDNGIKIFSSSGVKMSLVIEQRIEEIILNSTDIKFVSSDHLGKSKRIDDASGRYVEFVKSCFPKKMTLKGVKIFLDCAHGAAYKVAPLVFWELGAEVVAVGVTPDGFNINKDYGSLTPDVISQGTIHNQADVGIALDGDADRLIMSDAKGNIIDGDILLAIYADYLHSKSCLKNNQIVTTTMTNSGVIAYLEKQGINSVIADVGDRYVVESMLKNDISIGGEQSGHLIFSNYSTTGDGILAALHILEVMIETGKSLFQLASVIPKRKQAIVNVPVDNKPPLEGLINFQKILQDINAQLGNCGRILVRYSGTENCCRIMVEGANDVEVQHHAHRLASAIIHNVDNF
ncbi:Phosphoglucosamine mutase [Candidatus Clavichlamydia salmonicola]|uniref:phosphoglucosamine mutase n=1 Tax=Candidatus Clavichlamydia salmonicola TaxID=469812 RepID=UPI0018911274|nr:phosphoglucosamine mutase [Candidatus Clavichlamydia salmonicola]MBF5050458.1 Phosphoglucosamine mutase [Candidatus Clavichlamydia salmonicola]